MGHKIGVIILQKALQEPFGPLMEALFVDPKHLGLCRSAFDVGLLSDVQVAIGSIDGNTFIFSKLLASTIVGPADYPPSAPQEAWLLQQSQTADILVAYMHSITEICGHLVYHHGKRVALHFQNDATNDIVLDRGHFPDWYPASPLHYTEDYVLSLAEACIGVPLYDLLATEPALQLYEVG